ncbi:MAG: hypothetical protein NT053_08790 [Cyanobacteria bacterium]|nr:hypothetical protein [Cyanobacteriota bacterium]
MLAALGYLFSSLLGYTRGGTAAEQAFSLIRIIRSAPPFSDLIWVVVVGKCGTKTARLSDYASAVCDRYGYAQPGGGYEDTGYPTLVNTLTHLFDTPVGYSGAIGLVAGILFVIAIMLSSRRLFRSHWAWPVSMSVVMIGFPVQLLLERANLDAFIYLLMVASSVVISLGGGFAAFLLLSFLVFMAVALKAFPVFGFMGWLLSALLGPKGYRVNNMAKTAVGLGCALAIATLIPWAISTGKDIGFSGGLASYGFKALGYINTYLVGMFGYDRARLLIKGLILIKLLSVVAGVTLAIRASLADKVSGFFGSIRDQFFQKFSITLFLLMTWTWIGVYFLTISFDYKHVFMLPSALVFFAILDNRGGMTRFQRSVFGLLVALAIFITLFPLSVYANLLSKDLFVKFAELFGEVVVIPIYAGALGVILGLPLIQSVLIPRIARV